MFKIKGSIKNPLEEIKNLNTSLENAVPKLTWMGKRKIILNQETISTISLNTLCFLFEKIVNDYKNQKNYLTSQYHQDLPFNKKNFELEEVTNNSHSNQKEQTEMKNEIQSLHKKITNYYKITDQELSNKNIFTKIFAKIFDLLRDWSLSENFQKDVTINWIFLGW